MSQRRARQARQSAPRDEQPTRSGLLRDRRVWGVVVGVLALVAVVGVGIMAARGTGAAEPFVERGGDTVSFSRTDPVSGERVSLADYAGKLVVINVWGS